MITNSPKPSDGFTESPSSPSSDLQEILEQLENAVERTTLARLNGRTYNNRKIHADALTALESLIQNRERAAFEDYSGCPCTLVEPCSYACTCAKPCMSGGCMRCCRYGSQEQRLNAAKRLALQSKQEDRR